MCTQYIYYHGFILLQKINVTFCIDCSLSLPKEFFSIAQYPLMYLYICTSIFLLSTIKNTGNLLLSKDLAALSIICVDA
jgi:hypothetical protein